MSENYAVTASIGTAAVQVVPGNAGRNFLIIQNVGTVVAYFAFDANVTSTTYGFTLVPQAQMELSGPQTYGGPIYACTASSTTSVSYQDVSQ
jgi:hypothetical protein